MEKPRIRFSFIYRTMGVFLVLMAFGYILLYIDKKGLLSISPVMLSVMKFLISAGFVIIFTTIFLRFTVKRVFNLFELEMEIEQRLFFMKIYTIFVYFIALAIILYNSGVGLDNITLFLGLAATGIAFAVRDVILSFFVWLIIHSKKPFKLGDVVTSGDDTGTVDRIGTFFMTLKNIDGKTTHLIKVPNKVLLERNLKNHGKGLISGELLLPIRAKDLESQVKMIEKTLSKIKDADFSISFQAKEKSLYAAIRYSCKYEIEREVKLKAISLMYKNHPEILQDDKP